MAQDTQIVAAGQTYCVYFRGQACGGTFLDDYCRRFFLIRLRNALKPHKIELHAYCILLDEVYLLVTPRTGVGLRFLLGSISESYNNYYQHRFERESIPIGSNIKISRVVGNQLTLDCQKYMERRVLDLNLRQHAGAYEWSSYSSNAFGSRPHHITAHSAFTAYLQSRQHPYSNYREYLSSPFERNYLSYIDRKIRSGEALVRRRLPLLSPIARKRQKPMYKCSAGGSIINV